MKKALLLTAICAFALCSCTKSDDDAASKFGKAEIRFDLASSDYKGAPCADLLKYFSFTVEGVDFEGKKISQTLDANNLSYVITCNQTPTADKSYFATVGLNIAMKEQIPQDQTFDTDYSLRVYCLIYDKDGNEITHMKKVDVTAKGKANAKTFSEILRESFRSEFELCYVQKYNSDEWIYNFGISSPKK